MLRPIDIHNLKFKEVFRGYSREQVDEFFSKLVLEYESLYQQNQELKERIEELKKQANRYSDVEDTLQETLDYVKQSSAEIREDAEQTSARLIEEARKEADWILHDARQQVADEIRQAQEALAFRARVRRQLESQLRQLLEEVKQLSREEDDAEEASVQERPVEARAKEALDETP
ncbi:MAG: DivIVA domain-containing protein [Firmicutes bacterium]|nr:DivIVA domain-containing protein [Bacillota bacterium]